jgi:hypothetical protein
VIWRPFFRLGGLVGALSLVTFFFAQKKVTRAPGTAITTKRNQYLRTK